MTLKNDLADQIRYLLQKNQHGLSTTKIALELNINRTTAGRYLSSLLASGQAEMHHFGMTKIYKPSKRVSFSAVLSDSSGLILQLDRFMRIVFANEPFCTLIGAESADLLGKPVEHSPVARVFGELYAGFQNRIRDGITGNEWSGEIELPSKGIRVFCQILPMVLEGGSRGVMILLIDITQRKRAEQALLESEAMLRSVCEHSPDVILMVNRDLEITYINRTFTVNPDQVLGTSVLDYIPREFRPAAAACFEYVFTHEKAADYGSDYHFADRDTAYFESTVGPLFQDGKIVALVINSRDVTDRKHAEDELRNRETLYRTLAEMSTDLIYVIGRDDRVEYVNSYASELVNRAADQIIGQPRSSLFPLTVSRKQKKALHTVFETGNPLRNEAPLMVAGRNHWFDHYLVPLKDPDGHVRSVLGISRDITERKNTDEQLRESEQLYRKLLEQSFDAIVIHKNEKISFLNEQAARILGAGTPGDLIGRSILEIVHPDSRKDREERLRQIDTAPGEPVPVNREKFFRLDGTVATIDVMKTRFSDDGVPAVRIAFREVLSPE